MHRTLGAFYIEHNRETINNNNDKRDYYEFIVRTQVQASRNGDRGREGLEEPTEITLRARPWRNVRCG